jgi:FlaA1/EpsC-like NDP-sugar epimerase
LARHDLLSTWPSQTATGDAGLKSSQQNVHQQIILLAAVEFVLFAAAPHIAALIRFAADPVALEQSGEAYRVESAIFSVVLSLAALAMGLYSRRLRAGSGGLLIRFSIALLATLVAMAIIFYVVPELFLGRGLLGLSAVIAFIAFAAMRFAFARLCEEPFFRRRLLVYGTGRRVTGLTQLRRRSDRNQFSIVGYLSGRT